MQERDSAYVTVYILFTHSHKMILIDVHEADYVYSFDTVFITGGKKKIETMTVGMHPILFCNSKNFQSV